MKVDSLPYRVVIVAKILMDSILFLLAHTGGLPLIHPRLQHGSIWWAIMMQQYIDIIQINLMDYLLGVSRIKSNPNHLE